MYRYVHFCSCQNAGTFVLNDALMFALFDCFSFCGDGAGDVGRNLASYGEFAGRKQGSARGRPLRAISKRSGNRNAGSKQAASRKGRRMPDSVKGSGDDGTNETNEANPDGEVTLARGDLRLRVAALGASLRGLWSVEADGKSADIITGYEGAKNKAGGQGDVLIPFPGRVRDGKYTFENKPYQMPQNDKESPGAIHGFVRHQQWDIEARSDAAVTFATFVNDKDHPGYPFVLHVRVTYTLQVGGMMCQFEITNAGQEDAPVAAGFHPYLAVGSEHIDADTLTLPFEDTLEFANLLPTGRILPVENTPFDFRETRVIGDTVFNTCYLNPRRDEDGLLRVRLGNANNAGIVGAKRGRGVIVWMDKAFDYVVVYSGDPLPDTHRRRALAIEPMTCGTDAFNRPDWGLVTLKPNETFTGAWGVSLFRTD